MSLPLTRRIAKTVLLTAAGAASVVGTAGAASAAELPSTADVGGLTNLDTPDLGEAVDGASRSASGLTPKSATGPVEGTVPKLGKTVADEGKAATPRAMKLADDAGNDVHDTLREKAPSAEAKLPGQAKPESLPQSTPLDGVVKQLPVDGLSLGGLPIR